MPSTERDPADLREALESAGLRCTRQRLAVYGELLRSVPHHPSAEEVFRSLRPGLPRLSLATVYKALDALVAAGLVAKLTADDGSSRYDARTEHHYHLRCVRTGAVRDLPTEFDPDLLEKLDGRIVDRLRSDGFRVTGYRLELIGFFAESPPGRGPAAGATPTPATADDDR